MDKLQLILLLVVILIFVGGLAFFLIQRFGSGRQTEIRGMMGVKPGGGARGGASRPGRVDPYELDIDAIRKQTAGAGGKAKEDDIGAKLFRAGFFTADDRRWFLRFRVIALLLCGIVIPGFFLGFMKSNFFAVIGLVLGVLIGFTLPLSWLERQIRKREDEVLYYLPLVIEQVSIGVSSALDVGPCITQIISMAEERDSHNPVTEMFVHVEKLMRSGLNLEDALTEVAEANGMTEVKHAFMFLAQCAKHGGEVSKQLQELADSVMVQRQVQIEGKITALPVKATGPLAMVFAGFFALLFAGLLVNLLSAFGK